MIVRDSKSTEDAISTAVVLIRPRPSQWHEADRLRVMPPVNLMSIAGVLQREGISVEIIDFCALRPSEDSDVLDRLRRNKGCIVAGFSIMTVQVPHCLQLLKDIKQWHPEIKTVLGGIHAILYPAQTCTHPSVDYVCTGDGEYTMLDLVRCLSDEDSKSPDEIEGLAYVSNGAVQFTPPRELHKLDDLPYLPYELLDLNRYIYRSSHLLDPGKISRHFVVHAGQGCPFRCAFCINSLPQWYRKRYRGKTATRILDEVEYLIRKYQAQHFTFLDELFFVNPRRVKQFLAGIKERGLNFTWHTNVRADFFRQSYINKQFVKELEESGCSWLSLGAESGSQRVLDFICKDIKVTDILNAATALAGTRIAGGFSFMYGLPTETLEEIKATFALIGEIYKIHPETYIFGPQLFRPYPGSSLYDLCVKAGFPERRTLEDWSLDHNRELGYANLSDYKWLEDPSTLLRLGFYGKVAFSALPKSAGMFISTSQHLLRPIARWRLNNDWYRFPLEYWLFTNLKSFVQLLTWWKNSTKTFIKSLFGGGKATSPSQR